MRSPPGFAVLAEFGVLPVILLFLGIPIIYLTFNSFAHAGLAAYVNADDIPKSIPIIPDYALTINKTGSGTGTVTGREISCGSTCTGLFPQGTSIELTADPDTGSSFAGWSGGDCTGTTSCTLTMDAVKSVTAKFNKTCIITATTDINGTVRPLGPATTNQASDMNVTISVVSVNQGTSQTFRISPDPGYHVAGLQVDGIPVDVTSTYTFADVTSNHTITATFAPDSYASSDGNGKVNRK